MSVRALDRRRAEIALMLASGCMAIGIAELTVRLIDPLGISYYTESVRYHFDKIADDDLYYRHQANARAVYQGVEVTTNAVGLRERPIVRKEAGEYRVLVLGDSVAFGWGVRADDVFVRKLEAGLQARTARRVRTLNAGVGGYGTVQEEAF